MTTTETPRAADGTKVCAWCGGPIKQAGIGRSRDYCRRSCRQRAYEERRTLDRIQMATAASRIPPRIQWPPPDSESSRDEIQSTRDETPDPQVGPEIPGARPDGGAVPAERPALPLMYGGAGRLGDDEGEPDARPPRRGTK